MKHEDARFTCEIIGERKSLQKNGEEDETVVIFFDCERAPSVFPFRVPPLLNTNRVVYITTPMQASNYERFFTSSYFCADSLSGSTVEFS